MAFHCRTGKQTFCFFISLPRLIRVFNFNIILIFANILFKIQQLQLYVRYVRDLHELLRNCIKSFEIEDKLKKEYYEKQLSDFDTELKHYRQLSGQSATADLLTRAQQKAISHDNMK